MKVLQLLYMTAASVLCTLCVGCMFMYHERTTAIGEIYQLTKDAQVFDVSLSNKERAPWWIFLTGKEAETNVLHTLVRVEIENSSTNRLTVFTLGDMVHIPPGKTKLVFVGELGKQGHGSVGISPHQGAEKNINFKVLYSFGNVVHLDEPLKIIAYTSDSL